MLKTLTFALIALLTSLNAQAGLISNQDLHLENLRGQISQQLDTPALVEALHAQGISREAAEQRIARLSAAELNQLSQRIDELPAGSGFMTFLLVGFAIVVVTDALGYTDLFPFVKGPE
ncbi:MAG: hypothetical protein CSA54_00735 [Gammaproteobacteria bacterium]|nr:MAG: hypothetical protein CSA54_00735 [Gammaproteobacteria bacterium]